MTAIYFFQRFIWRPIIVKYEAGIPNELLTWMDAFWLWSTPLSVFLAPYSQFLHKEQFPFNPYNDFSVLEDILIGLCFIIRTVLKREKGRGRERKTKKLLIQAATSHWSKNISQGIPFIQKSWNILTFTFRLSKIPYFSNTAKSLFTNQVIPAVAGECCFISVKETFVEGYLLTQFSVLWIAQRWTNAYN